MAKPLITMLLLFVSFCPGNISGNAAAQEIWSLPVTVVQSEADQRQQTDQRREDRMHEESDLQAQWLAARSADWMVTLSWVQLLLTILTFGAAAYSIKLTRDTFISENRPVAAPSRSGALPFRTPQYPPGASVRLRLW